MSLLPSASTVELRERALNLLKKIALFRRVSRRLLGDVVERSTLGVAEDGGDLRGIPHDPGNPLVALVVLDGVLIATRDASGHVGGSVGLTSTVELPPGVYLGDSPRIVDIVKFSAPPGMTVHAMLVRRKALGTSPVLLNSLPPVFAVLGGSPSELVEVIWMASDVVAPLEALMHLLGGAVALDRGEPTALVALGGKPEVVIWDGKKFAAADPKYTLDPLAVDRRQLTNLVDDKPHGRVYVLNPPDPMTRPARLGTERFDRVVYLTDRMPEVIPKSLDALLAKQPPSPPAPPAPYFSSFIGTVVAKRKRRRAAGPFLARPLGEDPTTRIGTASPDADRLCRDACVVDFPLKNVAAAWAEWLAAGGPGSSQSFFDKARAMDQACATTASRWARAVTNRRVGVALSGGGACAYRIQPVLEAIERHNVPVDVFAGLSGGALVGAYYCHSGMLGLRQAIRNGLFFQVALPSVVVSTWPLQLVVNLGVDWARVEDLETRFVSVTTELPSSGQPCATAVVEGTLGEAVQASGTLPPGFGPTVQNGARYADGGASAVVPARVARNYGADVTLSCNAIPGPAGVNPFADTLLGTILHDWTPLGRIIDFTAWMAFMWDRTSRLWGEEADVFVCFRPDQIPFFESVCFFDAQGIVDRAASEYPDIDARAQDLEKQWKGLP